MFSEKVMLPICDLIGSKEMTVARMNELGRKGEAFFFLFDFELNKPMVIAPSELEQSTVLFDINGIRNFKQSPFLNKKKVVLKKYPIAKQHYQKAFALVQKEINQGNSYLLNLTFPTKIRMNLSLKEIFHQSIAKYKLFIDQQLVAFSPETFIKINNGIIASFPMKGTIDADLPDARQKILADKKEKAEHCTIVDLIRNDLNLVASKVQVEQFRYIDYLRSPQKNLLQVSSKITGQLPSNYRENIGDILLKLLPAGSISGAPKKKTVEIIQAAEGPTRGYYTGVFGYFDGNNLDSGVLIRYIQKINNQFYYRIGGGITTFSDVDKEYQELLDKIYVPIY
jgi:para-aminobenzoate synthetase component 1